MSTFSLSSVYAQLTSFANLSNFWSLFNTAFGSSYDFATAASFRSQWQSGDFSLFPQIEVVSSDVLGTAKGAYAISTNRIYLSDRFVSVASQQSLDAVILEEYGHFVDAQVNGTDTAGDEGELFSAIVRGISLSAPELSRIKRENDQTVIVVDGQSVAVEQAVTLVGVWDRLSYARAVTVVGNYAYAVGDTLEIIDISNPSNPVFKGNYDTANALGIQVVGNYAYVADGDSGLQIINISNPFAPTLTGSYDTPSYAQEVQIVGNYAYVADALSGLQIINISNPAAPTLTGSYDTPDIAQGIQVVGNYAYVADGSSGLQIINISNPAAPTLTGSYDTTGYAFGVQVVGNYAYVADIYSGLQIINISNPAAPTLAGTYDTTGYAYGVQVVGNYAYVADAWSGLQIINTSTPAAPTLAGTYDTPDIAMGIRVMGNYAYVADSYSGLTIINISNPASPTLTGSYDTGSAQEVQVMGNYAYVAHGNSGLQIINVSNSAAPTLAGTYNTTGYARGVQVVGSYAYIADTNSGLQIINISDPAAPTLTGSYNDRFYTVGVEVVGNYAYVATYDAGLQIINISNPAAPTLAGTYDTTGEARKVQVVGNYAYVADGNSGLQIINISNPAAPTLAGSYDTAGYAQGVQVVGNYAYIADSDLGLQIINISNPAAPTLTGTYDTSHAFGVKVVGNYAYVADGLSGLQIINISNPAAPTLAETYDTTGAAIGVQVVGNYAYVADSDDGLKILDVSDFTSTPATVNLAVAPTSVTEDGTGNLVYTFTRTGVTTSALTVNYGITGTADAIDYTGATPGTGKTITFAANSATATLTIDPTADAIVENNETVALTLATGTGYTIGTTTAVTGTITNDDAAIEIIGNTKLLKDGTNKYFAQVGNNTPVAIKNGTIYINEGMYAGWQTLAVETVNGVNQVLWTNIGSNTMHVWQMNTSWERTSTQSITLNSAASFTQETVFGVDANGDGVIGSPPSITLAVAPVSVLEDGTSNLVYTFTRTGATTSALTVNYGITGTAGATDYTGATPGTGKTITFAAGSATATLTIDPTADALVESNETVALTLATGTSYIIGTTTAVTGTITNDDTAIESIGNTKLLKDGTNKYFTQVGNNTPIAIKNGTIHINEGMYAGWQTLAVETVNGVNQVLWTNVGSNTMHVWQMNSSWERTSTQSMTLNSSAAFAQETVFGVDANGDGIIGSPPSITLSVAPASVTEDGTANLVYTFTRTGATTNALIVNYSITGTADATDYTGATPGTGKTITLNPGSATATLTIDPTADAIVEANETVALTLATGTGYTVGTTTAVTGTITNDDLPTITLDVNFSGISEDSPSNFVYTFTRTGATTNALTVNYGIEGTALSTDYTGVTPGTGKTIAFEVGSATATLTLDPTADTTLETDETISLQLTTGTGYSIGTTTAQITTIINDDGTRRQKGTNGKDVILGTNLRDILSGGLGNDILTGGSGGDSFSFNALNEGIDTITDFSVGNDDLFVKGSGFGGGLVSGDIITAAQFVIGTAATNTSQRFIYNPTNGALFFDVDGNGVTAASQFAILSPNLALTYEDIFVI
jgi:hypothetical protein